MNEFEELNICLPKVNAELLAQHKHCVSFKAYLDYLFSKYLTTWDKTMKEFCFKLMLVGSKFIIPHTILYDQGYLTKSESVKEFLEKYLILGVDYRVRTELQRLPKKRFKTTYSLSIDGFLACATVKGVRYARKHIIVLKKIERAYTLYGFKCKNARIKVYEEETIKTPESLKRIKTTIDHLSNIC